MVAECRAVTAETAVEYLKSCISSCLYFQDDNNFEQLLTSMLCLIYILQIPFSDITVKYGTQKKRAHKFVLAARSVIWFDLDLNNTEELELEGWVVMLSI